jgi:hypothetical protein
MQAKDQLKTDVRNKEELIITLQEAKQLAEDNAARLESELATERELLVKTMSQYEAKKEEHLREERKRKEKEIACEKQADQIKAKDQQLKEAEAMQTKTNEEVKSLKT